MSAYSEVTTEFSNGDLLLAALKEMGFSPTNCIGKPQPLVGFQGDFRTADGNGHTHNPALAMKADIIIPRSQVGGMSNDIGFVRGADGKFKAVISDYDSRRYNKQWLNKVKIGVADAGIQQQAKKMGLRMVGRKTDKAGQIQYQFLKQ